MAFRAAGPKYQALLAVSGAIGCVAAAAGAGAGTGIYLTSRGAKGVVNGSVSEVAVRAREVMAQNGIEVNATSTEHKGDQQELKGKRVIWTSPSRSRRDPRPPRRRR